MVHPNKSKYQNHYQHLQAYEHANKEWEKHFKELDKMQAADMEALETELKGEKARVVQLEYISAQQEIELCKLRDIALEAKVNREAIVKEKIFYQIQSNLQT